MRRKRKSMSYPNLYLIGLTGNIACGKSTVVAMLRDLGAHVLDADGVTRQLQEPGTAVYDAIIDGFGPQVATMPGGPLDRRALGAIVFSDPAALSRLEAIVHPAVHKEIDGWLTNIDLQASKQPDHAKPVAVIDAIKLLEVGWKASCDAIWVVSCLPEQQAARLMATRGMSEQEAWQRIHAQPPQSEKIAQADVVIDNSGTLEQTALQVQAAWEAIKR